MCSVWCVFYVIYLSGLAVVAVWNPAVPVQLTAGFDSVCNFHFKKKKKKRSLFVLLLICGRCSSQSGVKLNPYNTVRSVFERAGNDEPLAVCERVLGCYQSCRLPATDEVIKPFSKADFFPPVRCCY